MLRSPIVLLLLAAGLVLAPFAPLRADTTDPEQVFLSAYMSFQTAEKLESQGNFKDALAKYRYAGTVLDQLQQRSPDWNPLVLQFRKKKVAEAIQNLQERIAAEIPARPAIPASKSGQLDPNLLPGVSDTTSAPAASTSSAADNAGGDPLERAAREMRSQMAEIKAQLEQSRQQLQAVQREKARIAQQLEETTGKLDQASTTSKTQAEKLRKAEDALKQQNASIDAEAQTTQKALQKQLDDAKAEAAKAKEQLAKAKASETDLQGKLETARQQLEAESKQKDEASTAQAAALKKEMETLRKALDDAKADREVAEEQGELIHQRSIKLAKERDEAAAKASKLSENLAETEKKLVAAAQEREAARAEAATATQKLAESKKAIQTVTAERDDALAQLAKAQEEKGKAEKLLAENATLQKQLDEAQQTIAGLNAALPEKDKTIAGLQKQLGEVQDKLATAQKEGEASKTTIADLQKQLDDATAATAKAPSSEEDKKLGQENELLRGIVLRELKEQARREQARKLVMSELDRMKVRSKALVEQVGILSQPAVQLTETERALFKTPQMEIIDNTPGAMAISIAAPAQGSAEGALPTQGGTDTQKIDISSPTYPNFTPKVATEPQPAVPPQLQDTAKEAKDSFNRGKYLESARLYEKIVSKDPTNIYALSNLGVAHFRAGHLKQAEETLKKVCTLAPQDAFAQATLGMIYLEQARYDEAITALTQSVQSNPKSASAHNFLGIAAAKKGWSQAAFKELNTALELNPSYADAHYNLAVLLSTTQPVDKDAAMRHYKQALDLGMKADAKFEQSIKK